MPPMLLKFMRATYITTDAIEGSPLTCAQQSVGASSGDNIEQNMGKYIKKSKHPLRINCQIVIHYIHQRKAHRRVRN